MSIREVIITINGMETDGIIERYAIGGAVAATFYLERRCADWPVQFLPPATPLVEEALAQAREIDVDGAPARVFSAEHLAAIALQTGRAKDKARLLQFVEEGALDAPRFQEIVHRHNLVDAWARFERQFISNRP
jgi:hypothetical protein